jgi:hypothetical protein
MRLIAKAALGALALASLATASASAQYSVEVGPGGVAVEPSNPCLRAPAFRPAYCFRHQWRDRFAFNHETRDHMWRERMRERQAYLDRHPWMTPEERQAYLDRRYWDMTH